jgi:hypothetical protein
MPQSAMPQLSTSAYYRRTRWIARQRVLNDLKESAIAKKKCLNTEIENSLLEQIKVKTVEE